MPDSHGYLPQSLRCSLGRSRNSGTGTRDEAEFLERGFETKTSGCRCAAKRAREESQQRPALHASGRSHPWISAVPIVLPPTLNPPLPGRLEPTLRPAIRSLLRLEFCPMTPVYPCARIIVDSAAGRLILRGGRSPVMIDPFKTVGGFQEALSSGGRHNPTAAVLPVLLVAHLRAVGIPIEGALPTSLQSPEDDPDTRRLPA